MTKFAVPSENKGLSLDGGVLNTTPRSSRYTVGGKSDVLTPKTARRKPRERLELKYARVTRDDEQLYEEKLEWIANEQRLTFQKKHRDADRQAWEIFLETKMDTVMHKLTEQRGKEIDEMKRRVRVEKERIRKEKKDVEQAKQAEVEMKALNKELLQRARALFYGASTMTNFTAWKNYTANIKIQRAENKKRRIRRLKWCVILSIFFVCLIYSAYIAYITIQEEDRQRKAQAAEELAEDERRRSSNSERGGRLRRHLVAPDSRFV